MINQNKLFQEQFQEWPVLAENYQALEQILAKDISLGNNTIRLQCNPKRMVSTAANVTASAIQERPCFLCAENRPVVQRGIPFEDLTLLVNPFPVFERHFTIAGPHIPQLIADRWEQLLRLAEQLSDCVVFYNGAKCGASAPDHFHFQAGSRGILPLEQLTEYFLEQIKNGKKTAHLNLITASEGTSVFQFRNLYCGGWVLTGASTEHLAGWAEQLVQGVVKVYNTNQPTSGVLNPPVVCDAGPDSELYRNNSDTTGKKPEEPMMNVLCWKNKDEWRLVILPRRAHRPSCYYREDQHQRLISPASVEMGGLMIAARPEDYHLLTKEEINTIYQEVSWSDENCSRVSHLLREFSQEPLLNVGIVTASSIPFRFPVPYRNCKNGQIYEGEFVATIENNIICLNGDSEPEFEFVPVHPSGAYFELSEVVIGIGFHWERKEVQQFEGRLKFIPDGGKLVAVNRVPLESYLTSVISSEMSAKASAELLKAHAVISRSWLLAQVQGKESRITHTHEMVETTQERIKWYDREDHVLFDVCADDHCQRYQGITKAGTKQVQEAIAATRGLVLTAEGTVCDARFSKCCGGMMETFENCWENEPKTYLQGLSDCIPQTAIEGLEDEKNAVNWILGKPDAFCNTNDKKILEQVLNNYDQETSDFYRWEIRYSVEEISRLVFERSGIDFGTILDLIPIERGVSGRLIRLKIAGSKRTMILGKELEIRRILSPTHLYSSAFVVGKTDREFVLKGAGWGHGVGLCQIGAAVMGEKGFDFSEILFHYYPNTELKKIYQ